MEVDFGLVLVSFLRNNLSLFEVIPVMFHAWLTFGHSSLGSAGELLRAFDSSYLADAIIGQIDSEISSHSLQVLCQMSLMQFVLSHYIAEIYINI